MGAPRKGKAFSWGEEAERSGRISGNSRMERSGVSADDVASYGEERWNATGEDRV